MTWLHRLMGWTSEQGEKGRGEKMPEMAMGLARGHEGSRKTMTVLTITFARGTLPQGFRGLNPVHVLAE